MYYFVEIRAEANIMCTILGKSFSITWKTDVEPAIFANKNEEELKETYMDSLRRLIVDLILKRGNIIVEPKDIDFTLLETKFYKKETLN